MQPSEYHLPASPEADALDVQLQRLEPLCEYSGGQVDEVSGKVEREPAIAEEPCLETGGVRQGDHEHPFGDEQTGRPLDLLSGVRQVLQRMPEHNRRPLTLDVGQSGHE